MAGKRQEQMAGGGMTATLKSAPKAQRDQDSAAETPRRADLAVILPCYNPGAELNWTLDSLQDQGVPFKLFVTDDGSRTRPDYRSLLKDFDHELITLGENVGVCTVRNESIKRALEQQFDYLAIIDCGDWAHPTRFERQLEFLQAREDISAVGSAVELYDDDMNYLHDYFPPSHDDSIHRALFYGLAFKHPAMMFRASVFRTIGLYSADYAAAEDYELVRRAACTHKFANLPLVLLWKVESLTSVSATQRTNQLLSRLKIQWTYRDLSKVHCWLGLAKTLIVLSLPTSLILRLKPVVYNKRAPRLQGS